MKETKVNSVTSLDELNSEYEIDYKTVKRIPYYKKDRTIIELDDDVALYFQTSEQVNKVLKAIIKSFPKYSVAM